MRITKKMMQEMKRGMRRRMNELCALMATDKLKDEFLRCHPGITDAKGEPHEFMQRLLYLLLDDAIPAHWYEG